jgi:hypothetical protein
VKHFVVSLLIEQENRIDRIRVHQRHPRNPRPITAAAVCDLGRAKVPQVKPWFSRCGHMNTSGHEL